MDAAPGGPGSLRGVKVLVIGAGAREHALCRSLAADPDVTALACASGLASGRAAIRRSRHKGSARQPSWAALSGAMLTRGRLRP